MNKILSLVVIIFSLWQGTTEADRDEWTFKDMSDSHKLSYDVGSCDTWLDGRVAIVEATILDVMDAVPPDSWTIC
jgi:hypothetical protein